MCSATILYYSSLFASKNNPNISPFLGHMARWAIARKTLIAMLSCIKSAALPA
jgi:hypothetical protein